MLIKFVCQGKNAYPSLILAVSEKVKKLRV